VVVERRKVAAASRLDPRRGLREPAKRGRLMFRLNFQYAERWQDKFYAIKQVAPVVVEEQNEIVVITVYTFYF
jgi:hypothetical protein